MEGDYYPLTPCSLSEAVWIGWQFHRRQQGDGLVQLFRRAESPYETARFSLHGLDPAAHYRVTNLDTSETSDAPGHTLSNPGLPISIPTRPGTALLVYRRAQ